MKFAVFVLAIAVVSSSAESDPRVALLKRGTVKVLAWKAGNSRPYPGSAIMIGTLDSNTFFLTACHVVASTEKIRIQTFENREELDVSVYDDRCDDQDDVAVLVAPSYKVENSIEQIAQGDVARLLVGDRVFVLGHSSGREWILREAKVTSVTSTRIYLEPNVISDGDSGGPMLDKEGGLVGVIRGSIASGSGEGVRLDAALAVLEGWRVPYKTRLRVDFCEQITRIIGWSENNFSEIKGAQIKPEQYNWELQRPMPEWELRDKSMDLTGEGRSRVTTYPLLTEAGPAYVALYGKQANLEQARGVQSNLARQVQACLPKKENIFSTRFCLKLGWRKRWSHTPIFFFIHLDPYTFEVELIMYRTYGDPYVCKNS